MHITEYLALPLEERRNILKELLGETVPRGEVKGTAYAVGLSDSTLYKWRDPECEAHNGIRAELPHIIHVRQDLRLLDFLCRLFDHMMVPMPHPLQSLEDVSRHITQVFKRASGACQTVIDAMDQKSSGGAEITWEEFRRIQRSIREAECQLACLEEAARGQAAKNASWASRLVKKLGR